MSARSMWTGTLGFGMVSVPVKAFKAAKSEDFSFNQLHGAADPKTGKPCLQQTKSPKVCPVHGVVESESLVKGHKPSKDAEFVVVTKEDLESLPLPSKDTITISEFVPSAEVSPVFCEDAYWLEPDKGGKKAFELILAGLAHTNLMAIATVAFRQKEQLCAVRALNGHLVLQTLFYPSEVRMDLDRELPAVNESSKEFQMAVALMHAMTQPFDPEQYTDHYKEAVQEMIDAKLSGVAPVLSLPAPKAEVDLMAVLEASLAQPKPPKVPVQRKNKQPA